MENAVRACPSELWGDPSAKPAWKERDVAGFWYVVYHTLLFLDFYMSDSPATFEPPAPFTKDELDPAGLLPPRLYTKDELLIYLDHCRKKFHRAIAALTEEHARGCSEFKNTGLRRGELLLYLTRHVQHHAGQLNLLLRQHTGSAPRWVKSATVRM